MKARRTPLAGLTERQREIELGNAHALMVESGVAAPTFNEDCPACSWPPEVYERIAKRATSQLAVPVANALDQLRDIGPE